MTSTESAVKVAILDDCQNVALQMVRESPYGKEIQADPDHHAVMQLGRGHTVPEKRLGGTGGSQRRYMEIYAQLWDARRIC